MTLKDVARVSGCSVATVSKVFKNSPEISEGTKARVLKAAKQVGYLDKATAKSLTLGGHKPVVFADASGKYSGDIVSLTRIFEKYEFTLIYVALSSKKAEEISRQIGAWGTVVTENNNLKSENIFRFSDNQKELEGYLDKLSRFVPKRAPRTATYKGDYSGARKTVPAKPVRKQDDIWLL